MIDVIHILGYIAGGIGVIVASLGYFGKARSDSIIESYGEAVKSKDALIATLKEDLARAIAQRDIYKQQADTFKDAAQGSPQLVRLASEIKALVKQVTLLVAGGSQRG